MRSGISNIDEQNSRLEKHRPVCSQIYLDRGNVSCRDQLIVKFM